MTQRPHSLPRRLLLGVALISACGLQFGIIPSCEGLLTTFNPCGTIFGFCEPTDVDLLFTNIPDFTYDPTCTIPGFGFDSGAAGAVPASSANGCADQPIFPHTPGIRP